MFSSVTVVVEEGVNRVSGFHSIGLVGFDSTGTVSGSGELDPALPEVDPALPEVGGELAFVQIAGIVATRACSAEITTLGGISCKEF